ncbi:MAG: preprotein translocase subunit Sec61beta [Candidatus Thermoplasmatota archaeon]|nr:preprotein translocase subunit Sec61beta [Candidatus Thermoplasmatota archaeon]MBU3901744.1 preprotein translocase subunit Sec61beta [Candidatus Thermoplasmatota archaeon]MBU4255983.1 preprotein translocase subunit Sec61beta [Candidatus Thermoplasmatota archaeon]
MAQQKKGKKGEGFHSAAGLIRYFDSEEETALKIDPKLVIAFCIGIAVTLEVVKYFKPM